MQGPEPLPERIGRYQIEAELGRGMMGSVYRAVDPLLGRPVAIKVIRLGLLVSEAQRRTFEARFTAEGRIIARLEHPGIVTFHDYGHDDALDCPYLVLELLEGRTLRELMHQDQPLDWRTSVGIVGRIARALHYAHERGVIHRDLKPANVMILRDGTPKLMDFGIARLPEEGGLTQTGEFLGTPLYVSPEQARGEDVDARSDLFGLGSVAYSLLTGRDAFAADAVPIQLDKIARFNPPAPSTLRPELPASIDYVVSRAMAKPPEARYAHGGLFADDLEDVLAGKPPRHQTGWRPVTVPGGDTLVAGPPAAPPGPPAAEPRPGAGGSTEARSPPAAPTRPRRRGRLWLLAASVLVLGAALYLSDFWGLRLRALVEGDREAERARILDSLAVAAEEAGSRIRSGTDRLATLVAEQGGSRPSGAATNPPGSGEAAGDPLGSEALVSRERVAGQGSGAARRSARLSGSLEHELPGGELHLWLDDVLVFRGTLAPGPASQALVFWTEEGGYQGVLPVEPGDRSLRVHVVAGETEVEGTISGVFIDRRSRHLDVRTAPRAERLVLAWRGEAGATGTTEHGEAGGE